MGILPDICDPLQDFGLPKENYDTDGVIDPATDVEFSEWENMAVAIAAMSRTAARAIVHIKFTAGAPAVEAYDSSWGSAVGVRPTPTDNGVGDTTLTWAAAGYPDLNPTPARQVTRTPAFRFADVEILGSTPHLHSVEVTANTIRVYTTTHAGVAGDVDFYLFVY